VHQITGIRTEHLLV